MNRKREPVAVEVEGGVLVKFTNDVEEAAKLARQHYVGLFGDDREYALPQARVFWCRVMYALPNTWAAAEGHAWQYRDAKGPARGVFPAVEFVS